MRKYKVMLVDDEPLIRTGLNSLIDWEGLNCEVVYEAEDGEQALQWLMEYTADILICDIRMPGMDGLELARRLYESNNPIKVIFLSAYSEFSYVQKALHYDAIDYVVKSNYIEKLPSVVQKTVALLEKERQASERISTIQDQLRVQTGERQVQLVQDILRHNAGGPEQIESRAWQAGLAAAEYRLLWISFRGSLTEKSRAAEKKAMETLRSFIEAAYREFSCVILSLSPMELAVLAAPAEGAEAAFDRKLALQSQSVLRIARETMNIRLNIGLSGRITALAELPRAKEELSRQISSAVFYQRNLVISSGTGGGEQLSDEAVRRISEAVRQHVRRFPAGSPREELEEILERCREEELPIHYVWDISTHLISVYREKIRQVRGDVVGPWLAQFSGGGSLYQCRTLPELLELLRQAAEAAQEAIASMEPRYSILVERAVRYIQTHFREEINLASVADELHVNRSYLGNQYKKETGESIVDAINRRRMEAAAEMLRKNLDMRIFEIAQSVGFEDPAYFSNVFARYMGMSPKAYRMKNDKN